VCDIITEEDGNGKCYKGQIVAAGGADIISMQGISKGFPEPAWGCQKCFDFAVYM
jgi:hypothetical protein